MTKDEALKLALDAFGEIAWSNETQWQRDRAKEAITAIKEALAQPEQEPVAWVGLDLDGMVEAFHRVIEEHHSRKNPFHDPVNGDAMLALRELRGLIAYMKRNTTPPQRKPLTDDEIKPLCAENHIIFGAYTLDFIRAIEAAHGIKGGA